jgi:AraC-like DNA-binding protein
MSSIQSPLTEVLKRVEFWLERDGASRIIVAAPSLKKLKQQELPDQMRATPRKLQGPRQPIRGRRHYNQQHKKLARWPNDGMDENVLPFILCVLSGQADFRIADYVLHCKVGDWVFVPAGVPKQNGNKPHFEGDPTGRQCDVLWIYTGAGRDEGITCWICRSKGQEHFQEKNANCNIHKPLVAQLFNGFCEEIQEARRREITLHLLRGVLLLLRSEIEAGAAFFGGTKQVIESETPRDPIEEAQFYIITNIYRHLTIQNVARQVLVSPSTLIRHFRERTGQSFNEYLNLQRLKFAEELLKETDLPVSVIGEKVGLKYGQLRILFLQKHQCSPGEFRANKK